MAKWNSKRGSGWKRSFRNRVAKRFGYDDWIKVKCCKCKRLANSKVERVMDMHHIQSTIEYPELAFEVCNIVPLCNECHSNFHRKYNVRIGRNLIKLPDRQDLVKFLGPVSSIKALLTTTE